jgi:VanZ family protein
MPPTPRTLFKYWFPVLIWMGVIFWMSTGMFSWKTTYHVLEPILRAIRPEITHYTIVMINNSMRKAGHVIEYFISGILVFRAFKAGSAEPHLRRWAFSSVLFIIAFALSDEFHQSFVTSRTASLVDVGIDTGGGLLAVCVSMLRYYRKQSK